MNDTVDLIVIGVEEGVPRADISSKLVKKFKQEAYTFEALLDGAYGESAPYAAQTGVERSLAEGGKEQLESVGLVCTILPTGEKPEPLARAPIVTASEVAAGPASNDPVVNEEAADSALATFKSRDDNSSKSDEVAFDVDEVSSEESALASFKKDAPKDKKEDNGEVDFSELGDFDADGMAGGLADAKKSKVTIDDVDDSLNHDFSDQIGDVGGDKLASGLAEGKQAKPDFNAEVQEVDFSDDVGSIGIHEDPSIPQIKKSKLEEEAAERNLNSFPKENVDEETIDFSDELEVLSSDAVPVAANAEGAKNKADVPEALADGAGEDLDAELIDPAPAEKEKKAPVEVDDGGLSLSADEDAPLTTPAKKSNPEVADDGGLSLSGDDSAPLTTPKSKAEPAASDDGGLSLSADAEAKAESDTTDSVADNIQTEGVTAGVAESVVPEPVIPEPKATAPAESKVVENVPEKVIPEPDTSVTPDITENVVEAKAAASSNTGVVSGGLVLPGQLSNTVVPNIVSEDQLDGASSNATDSLRRVMPEQPVQNFEHDEAAEDSEPYADRLAEDAKEKPVQKKSKKKLVAAVAGLAVLTGAGSFAFMNAGSIAHLPDRFSKAQEDVTTVKDATGAIEKMHVEVANLQPGADLETLSTGQLLVNLSNNQRNGIVELEPYFIESGDAVKRGPRLGAAVPAESERMIRHRQPHPADAYFDDWSTREGDLSLFLALMDNLIEKGDLEVAQQLSDRAKDKLFSVMSTQRLARAYSDVGENANVTRLMTLASRDTYAIKAPEERVLALSDYAFTEQAIGLNEDAMDTFLKTSILARSLVKPEKRAVGLSSAALYFHRSGRTQQAQDLLEQSLQAGFELPENTAAKDLAIRYIALSEARMGLFNQAMEHAELIVDPIATVSTYHGIALAIESSGDNTNARKVLNKAYRAGSLIEDEEERRKLLSKVVLASEAQ